MPLSKEQKQTAFDKWFENATTEEKLSAGGVDSTEFISEFFESLANDGTFKLDDLESNSTRYIGEKLQDEWREYRDENISLDITDYDESIYLSKEEEKQSSEPASEDADPEAK